MKFAHTASLGLILLAWCQTSILLASKPIVPSTWREDADIHDVFFINSSLGWAVGDHGTIWHTVNGGEVWHSQPSQISSPLTSVHFVDEKNGWIAAGKVAPLAPDSKGFILRTTDGGATWEIVDDLLLPWLDAIHFSSKDKGIAVGKPSSLFPFGAWATKDGGATWTPFTGLSGVHWIAHDFRGDTAIVLGRHGELVQLENTTTGPRTTRLTRLGNKSSATGFAQFVNDQVLLAGQSDPRLSVDSGRTWQPVGHFPQGMLSRMQLRSLDAKQQNVWMLGSPGNRVLMSQDYGAKFQAMTAPTMLWLNRIRFLDQQNGWAAGARGTILVTRDGGTTWKRQRKGDKRISLLCVCADERDIPWELLAQASAIDDYRSHIVVLGRSSQNESSELSHRLHCAANRIGATAELLTDLVLQTDINLPAQSLLSQWQRDMPGGTGQLSQKLTQLIRIARPDIVVTPKNRPDRPEIGSQSLLSRFVADACDLAAKEEAYPDQLQVDRLSTWNVGRVLAYAGDNQQRGKSLRTQRVSPHGFSAKELSRIARDAMSYRWDVAEPHSHWTLNSLKATDDSKEIGASPFAGLSIAFNSTGRRARTKQPVASGKPNFETQFAMIGMAKGAGSSVVERADYIQRVAGSNTDLAARLLLENARQANDVARQIQFLHQLVDRYPKHELAAGVQLRLLNFHTSVEQQWLHRESPVRPHVVSLNVADQFVSINTQTSTQVQTASATETVPDQPSETVVPDWKPAMRIMQRLRQEQPTLYANPQISLGLYSLQSQLPTRPSPVQRKRNLNRVPRHEKIWNRYAMQEAGLLDADQQDPTQLWACKQSDQRPHLDGKLQDAIWKSASFRPLTAAGAGKHENGDNKAPTLGAFAKDDEFLYLAAYCPKRPDVAYPPLRKKRPRDGSLAEMDRIEIRLDVNRDYSTWWTFHFDCRGWTRDGLNHDLSWDPAYYVASAADPSAWTIEVAIPLDQLAPSEYCSSSYWAIDIRRIVPGRDVEHYWGGDNPEIRPKNPPELSSLMHLE